MAWKEMEDTIPVESAHSFLDYLCLVSWFLLI